LLAIKVAHEEKIAAPRQVRCVGQIPKTNVGKVDNKMIRQSLLTE